MNKRNRNAQYYYYEAVIRSIWWPKEEKWRQKAEQYYLKLKNLTFNLFNFLHKSLEYIYIKLVLVLHNYLLSRTPDEYTEKFFKFFKQPKYILSFKISHVVHIVNGTYLTTTINCTSLANLFVVHIVVSDFKFYMTIRGKD